MKSRYIFTALALALPMLGVLVLVLVDDARRRSLTNCDEARRIDSPAKALEFAERIVRGEPYLLHYAGMTSHEELLKELDCPTFCRTEYDGAYWTVWFSELPKALEEKWTGRVEFTRCGKNSRIWG